jgi:hypothetical protein
MGELSGKHDLPPNGGDVLFRVLLTAGCFTLVTLPLTLLVSLLVIRRRNWRVTATNPDSPIRKRKLPG